MKFGAPFLGSFAVRNPITIRDYVQAIEGLGYEYLFADEVLLNNNPQEVFHESLTLFAHLSAVTNKLKFVTGVMILPKRSTILVARQAAEVDLLSNGRLRLGVGVGWNEQEFQTFGIDFKSRGKRIEEQIKLLRELWTIPKVTFEGEYHHIKNMGINLLPVQRPIPIWIGGSADIVLRRAARIGDGWLATITSFDKFKINVTKLRGYLDEFGRKKQDFRIVNYLPLGKIPQEEWGELLSKWRNLGISHAVILPSTDWGADDHQLQGYIEQLRKFMVEYNN